MCWVLLHLKVPSRPLKAYIYFQDYLLSGIGDPAGEFWDASRPPYVSLRKLLEGFVSDVQLLSARDNY